MPHATQTATEPATATGPIKAGILPVKPTTTAASAPVFEPLKPTGLLDKLYAPTELTPVIGTQFDNVDLSKLIEEGDAEVFRELAILIHRRNVVFFRSQSRALSNIELKTLASRLSLRALYPNHPNVGEFGALHIHPTEKHGEDDEISPITAVALKRSRKEGSALASRGWHTDITFEPVPSDIAILNVWEIPPSGGGDTLWASAYEAYDRLTPAYQKFVEGLTAVHSGAHFHKVAERRGIPLHTGVRGHPLNAGPELEAVHPVVRVNPVTGWKGLFVNPVFTRRIVELNQDESETVLKYLFSLFTENHDLAVRFKWDKNAVALWSNTSSLHNVTLDYDGTNRTGHRAVSLGERPYFDAAQGRSRRADLGLGSWFEDQ
ncbi:hypothetical protein JCM8097_005412 [Rhodosporidiobolus ruineniae]